MQPTFKEQGTFRIRDTGSPLRNWRACQGYRKHLSSNLGDDPKNRGMTHGYGYL